MIFGYLLMFSLFIALFFKTKRSLHMLQQNLYNENNRFMKWLFKNIKQFASVEVFFVIVSLIGVFVIYDLEKISYLCYFLMIIVSLIDAFIWYIVISTDQNKKPLVVTKRIKRLIFTISIIYLIPSIIYIKNIGNLKLEWILLLIISMMIYLNQLVILLANIINKPIEKLVYFYYKNKAKNKLLSMSNLKVIGVTGSYGKTSSKNILSSILNIKYNALATPKNLNTYYGLMMTINNNLDKFTDIFIAEMGAYVRGEIKELCDFVKPKYGILLELVRLIWKLLVVKKILLKLNLNLLNHFLVMDLRYLMVMIVSKLTINLKIKLELFG